MTAETLANKLRPLAEELLLPENEELSPDVQLARALIFFTMSWLEQMTPHQRQQAVTHLAIHVGGLFAVLDPFVHDEDLEEE